MLKTPLSWHQVELHDTERELNQLIFRAEVLNKEKELLAQFADHVAKVHSIKVCVCLRDKMFVTITLFLSVLFLWLERKLC